MAEKQLLGKVFIDIPDLMSKASEPPSLSGRGHITEINPDE